MKVPEEFDIEGQTVIVSGAARGIGKGIVRVLAEAGSRVLVTALTDRYLVKLRDELAVSGNPVDILMADATDSGDWKRTIEVALGLWGHIDVLINNVGDAIPKPIVPLPNSETGEPLTDSEWQRVIDINLTQAFMGCRAIGPHFLQRKKGKVINVSGIAASRGTPHLSAYSAAKAGLVRMTQALAWEWADFGVTVNSIAPGHFPDPETNDPDEIQNRIASVKSNVPLGRVGEIREVGLLAHYMVSSASNYMTGETVFLDGGASFA